MLPWRGVVVNSFIGKEVGEEGMSRELIDWLELFYSMLKREQRGGVKGKKQSCSRA